MTALTPEQRGALGRPVARRAGAVLLARQHDERRALLEVVLGGLEDGRLLAVLGEVAGEAALGARRQLVAQPDVGERAADHHLVVAAARAVGVEVPLLPTPCSARYLPAGLSFLIAPAGLMWSVVTESPSLSSTRAPSMSSTGSGSSGIPSK